MNHAAKAWAFLAVTSLTLIVLGHAIAGREGLLFALIIVLSINSFVYFYEDRRILNLFRGIALEGQDPYGLRDIIRRMCLRVRIPHPKIVILPSDSPQALVVGRGVTHGTILLTEGLLRRFTRPEIEAVLAYQIASLKTLNTLAFAVGSFVTSALLFVSEILDSFIRLLIVEKKNPRTPVSQLFTRLAAPFVGLVLRLSIRPSLYLQADHLAAELCENPKILAQVIWKLDSYAATEPLRVPMSTAHMFMVSPLTLYPWMRHFRAHPATERRVRELVGSYPI